MLDQEIVKFAHYLADLSSGVAKKYFRRHLGEKNKDNDTPVTLADHEIEETLEKAIKKHFPKHGIVGEEFGNYQSEADYKWVIDPIDGTLSFIIGRPIFGTLIALSYKDQPILGIINQPITKERWIGIVGQKTKLNNRIVRTRECDKLSEAVFCTTSPFFFEAQALKMINTLTSRTKYQKCGGAIYGGDCYLFALLASGLVDIIVECGLKSYDFMALVPVVKAAGGFISDWSGQDLHLHSDGTILACGSKKIYEEVFSLINNFV